MSSASAFSTFSLTGFGAPSTTSLASFKPKPVKEKVEKAEAEEIKKKLEEAGATVEVK